MSMARVKIPQKMERLLHSDWKRIIREANLGREDTLIAARYILEAVAQADIAAECNMDRSTVSRRLKKIMARLDFVAEKLGLYQ